MINEISIFICLLKKSFQEDYDAIQKSNYLRIIFLLKLFFFTYPFDTRLRSFCYRVFHNFWAIIMGHPVFFTISPYLSFCHPFWVFTSAGRLTGQGPVPHLVIRNVACHWRGFKDNCTFIDTRHDTVCVKELLLAVHPDHQTCTAAVVACTKMAPLEWVPWEIVEDLRTFHSFKVQGRPVFFLDL